MDIGAEIIARAVEVFSTVGAVGVVVYKLGKTVQKFEALSTQQSLEISELKGDIKVVSDIVTKVALQNQRLDMGDQRVNRLEQIVDDLRRGEGKILPLNRRLPYEEP